MDATEPADMEVMREILKQMAIEDYEPAVLDQMLEFFHGYVSRIVKDARVYSEYAKKTQLDLDDVRLAVRSRVNESFSQVPPREIMLEVAAKKNSIPLPIIAADCGLRLPPAKYRLTEPNFQHEGLVPVGEEGDDRRGGAKPMETD
eukprot:c29307_g1_i1.p1 GENE.c29307_g1_i1~~c29307_g1_i1.p1  ORF type:complete len:146 (+),score=29.05 c29307_g1_i1:113-550(+)